MKKYFTQLQMMVILIAAFVFTSLATFAQEEVTEEAPAEPQKERPARPAFESGLLFDNATSTIQPSKTLEMIIQHRFGTVNKGSEDLFGLWAPANIRLGLNYSLLDNLMVGVGTTKFNKMQDIQVKYNILQQTRSNSIPLSITFYEVVGIDASAEGKWGTNYKFMDRMSYFTQVIFTKRFNDMLSLSFAPSFTHYNSLDSLMDHDRIALTASGRIKFSPQSSIIFSGDFPLMIQGISEHRKEINDVVGMAKPNICIGLEVATSTHAFHIYAGSAQNILPQENIMFNKNDFFDGGILIGLNVTRLWNF